MSDGSYIALVNADEGTIKLTENAADLTINEGDLVEVVTDNPFVQAKLGSGDNAGNVIATYDGKNGLKALSSLGMQAMTRRADSVLASTIADRTSFGQNLKPTLIQAANLKPIWDTARLAVMLPMVTSLSVLPSSTVPVR